MNRQNRVATRLTRLTPFLHKVPYVRYFLDTLCKTGSDRVIVSELAKTTAKMLAHQGHDFPGGWTLPAPRHYRSNLARTR